MINGATTNELQPLSGFWDEAAPWLRYGNGTPPGPNDKAILEFGFLTLRQPVTVAELELYDAGGSLYDFSAWDSLGASAAARLEIVAPGSLTTYGALLGTVGVSSAVHLTGASWEANNFLIVGSMGGAHVGVGAGAVLRTPAVQVGLSPGGVGSLYVGGDGEMLVNGGATYVGYLGGSGELRVQDSATVSTSAVVLGFGGGSGTLRIRGGVMTAAVVKLQSGTAGGSLAHLELDGGVLEVGMLDGDGDANDRVTFRNGTLRMLESDPALFDDFSPGRVLFEPGYMGTLDVPAAKTVATSHALGGFGGLIKNGAGILELKGANTYFAGTDVRRGELKLAAGGSITHDTSNIFFPDAGMLRVGVQSGDNGTLTIQSGATLRTLNAVLGDQAGATGAVQLRGTLIAGQFSEGSGGGSLTVDGGTFGLLADQPALFSGFEAGDLAVGVGGLTFDTRGFSATSGGPLSGSGQLTKTGAGRLTLTAANTHSGGTRVTGGILQVNQSAALGGGAVTVTGSASRLTVHNFSLTQAVTLADGGELEFSGTAAPGAGFSMNHPAGTLRFSGTYRPSSLSATGSLAYAGAASAGNAFLSAAGKISFLEQSDSGSATMSATQGFVFGDTARFGGIASTAGEFRLEGLANGAGGNVTGEPGAIIDVTGHAATPALGAINGTGTLRLGSRTLRLGSDFEPSSFAGAITGTAESRLVKTGFSSVGLSGAQPDFAGAVVIEQGTLIVDNTSGLALGGGLTTVDPGATLAGAGRVGRVRLGGRLSPGFFSAANLQVDSLSLAEGSVLSLELIDVVGAAGVGRDHVQCGELVFDPDAFFPPTLRITGAGGGGDITGFDRFFGRRWTVLRANQVKLGSNVASTPPALTLDTSALSVTAGGGEFSAIWISRNGGWDLDVFYAAPALSVNESYPPWAARHDASLGGPNADPDGDGASNAVEFLHGTSPFDRSAVPPQPMFAHQPNGALVFTFPSVRNVTDLPPRLQQSADLKTWTDANPSWLIKNDVWWAPGFQNWNYTVPANAMTTQPRLFLRISVPTAP